MGSCFPSDLAAFRSQAIRLGYRFGLLDEIARLNNEALNAAFNKVQDALWNLEEKRVVLLGLAVRQGIDDVCESPSLRLAQQLGSAGAKVVIWDPRGNASPSVEAAGLEVVKDVYAAAEGADCLVVCTEWAEIKTLDLTRLRAIVAVPVIVDCRNLFDPDVVRKAGFTYLPTGRPALKSARS